VVEAEMTATTKACSEELIAHRQAATAFIETRRADLERHRREIEELTRGFTAELAAERTERMKMAERILELKEEIADLRVGNSKERVGEMAAVHTALVTASWATIHAIDGHRADAAKQSKKLVELQGEMRQEIETTKAKRDEKFKFAEPDDVIDLPGPFLSRPKQVN
jgi:hypothetical protein